MSQNSGLVVSASRDRLGRHYDAWYWNILPDKCGRQVRIVTRQQAMKLIAVVATLLFSLVLIYQWTGVGEKTGAINANDSLSGSHTEQSSAVLSNTNQRPHHDDIRQLGELDAALIPGNGYEVASGQGRRLIFVGDIHGCFEELLELLSKADYNAATDHIVVAGDMVNKGPNSASVVDFLIAQGASCVRGNHDDRILSKHVMDVPAHIPGVPEDREMALAKSLTTEQIAYLKSCPIVLRVGMVPTHSNILVVHAGLVPSLELVDQDPILAMNMRIIDPLTHIPSKEHDKEGHMPWADFWNQEQTRVHDSTSSNTLANKHLGTTVIYGHDAKRGLQLKKYTKGLDSGCVRGQQLTALILSDNAKEEIVQVSCHRYSRD